MPSYLISWKLAIENEERGWPVEDLIALSERLRQTGAAQERWRFRRRDGVKVGERVFVVRQGRAGHAIIGYGKVAEIPKRNDGYTAVSFDILLNPTSKSVLATEDELHAITTKRGVWNTTASGIALSSDVASRLESLVVNREPIPDVGKPTEPTGARWNLDELRAAVQSYLEMQRAVRAGKEVNKKAIYRDLSHRFGRTEKAYEYRMQNISYVLSLQGRTWIPGLVPARNVGTSVAGDIEMILAELEGRTVNRVVLDEVQVQNNVAKGHLPKPPGARKPRATTTQTTQYDRDLDVRAWVLIAAKGKCECCNEKAPFTTAVDTPYLEVHHVRKLADGGSDTVENAVALCPNCHRQLHYGRDANSLVERLYLRVTRLIRE
jgi:5-methylcytosine-specific restriction protein A